MEEEKTTKYFSSVHGYKKFQNNKNKFDKKSIKDKSSIKCHRCERLGHYANECRISEHKLPNVRNPNSGQNHEHITCFSDKFVKNENKFLIDSGSEINVIKISTLKGHIIVNERDKKNIKGIHASPVGTIESIVIPIYINEQSFVVKFDIVEDDFPIPEADWDKEVVIIPEKINNNTIIIPPRSNCVLQIKVGEKIDHKLITVKKHEINENVIIANSISTIRGDKIISNIINISEQPFIIEQLTTSNLKWEPYNDNVLIANEENQS
ncbi:hypothetical protein AGLY_017472, partial [Aphis glycines]